MVKLTATVTNMPYVNDDLQQEIGRMWLQVLHYNNIHVDGIKIEFQET